MAHIFPAASDASTGITNAQTTAGTPQPDDTPNGQPPPSPDAEDSDDDILDQFPTPPITITIITQSEIPADPITIHMSPTSTIADLRAHIARMHPQRPAPGMQWLRLYGNRTILTDLAMTIEELFRIFDREANGEGSTFTLEIVPDRPGSVRTRENAPRTRPSATEQIFAAAANRREQDQSAARRGERRRERRRRETQLDRQLRQVVLGLAILIIAPAAVAFMWQRVFRRRS